MSSDLSRAERAEFLRGAPIFAGLDAATQDEIAAHSSWIRVPAGEWLFRQGDLADSLYLIASGRLEVVVEEPETEIVRVLSRNDAVGELALLTESARSASVRARRDSELLRVTEARFSELLRSEPEFALALTRALGRQLGLSRGLPVASQPLPATIAVVSLQPDLPVDSVADGLLESLRRWGRAVRLDGREQSSGASDRGPLLDRCEREHDQVLLVAGAAAGGEQWTDFCLREADRVIALARGDEVPRRLEIHPRLRGCDLLFCGSLPSAAQAAPWLDALEPRVIRRLGAGATFTATLEGIARRLAGRSVGVVLSGGGARGLAHIGVLEELLSSDLEIDRIGGCSMGAFVGAMFAMGLAPSEIRARCYAELVRRNPLNDYTVPLVSLVRGHKAAAMLVRTFGERTIEELPREFYCVSCDLLTAELVVHRSGPVFDAVAASMCLPGVIAPIASEHRLLVDGGVLNNLPVSPMAESGEGPVIAVDVTAQFRAPVDDEQQRSSASLGRLAVRVRDVVVGNVGPLPNLKEILTRAIGIGSVDSVVAAREQADLVIAPATGPIGMLDFAKLDWMIEAGRSAARTALATRRILS